jgi:hypothetical protein
MTDSRIRFIDNPWPEGHPIAEFEWTSRVQDGRVWFDLHLRSADYSSERRVEDDEDTEYDNDWEAPIVWNNYHRCTLSSTHWGDGNGFEVCAVEDYSPEWLDGRAFIVEPVERDMSEIEDLDALSFHIYLLGHDSVANHRIEFRRTRNQYGDQRGNTSFDASDHRTADHERFDIFWNGDIALTYTGNNALEHRFEARIVGVPFPRIPPPTG